MQDLVLKTQHLMPAGVVSVRTYEQWRDKLWPRLKQAFAETGDPRYEDEWQRLDAVCQLAVRACNTAPLPYRLWWQRLVEQDLTQMWRAMKGAKNP